MATIAESTTGQVDERFNAKYQTVVTETTTARALTASDLGSLLWCTNTGATTITVPAASSTAGKTLPIGSWFEVVNKGSASNLTVAVTTDTLTGTATVGQNVRKKVVKVAATEWYIY